MKRLWGKLVCRWNGKHLRGVKVGEAVKPDGSPHYADYNLLRCPRCGATWNRKQRKKAAA